MPKTTISNSMHTLRFTPVKSVTATHSATMQDGLEHESHTFIVALGAIFQESPLVIIVRKDSNINSVKDLKNKKIMITLV